MDRLYGLPPDEFTTQRNELAKRLRDEGRRDEAAVVKKLKRPTLPAWAVNQLVRRHRREVRRLLEAGASVRTAHEELLSGGAQAEFREAAAKERELVGSLVKRAEPLLGEAGSTSATNLERIRSTLHAAATDEQLRGELEAGRIVEDRGSVGLGPFAVAEPAAPGSATARRRERAAARRHEVAEARARAARAAKQLRSAEARLERAREEAEAARRELRARKRSAEAARQEAEAAEAALRQVEAS